MRKSVPTVLFVTLATALGITLLGLEKTKEVSGPILSYQVRPAFNLKSPNRIGINLGQWTSWGAQQYGSNVLMNPGFEGGIDRVIVIVSLVDERSFSDEAGWGYPDHEWDEAAFEVRTGKSAGRQGVVQRSLNSGKEGFPQYFADKPLPSVEANDIIVLTKVRRPDPPDYWQTETPLRVSIDTSITRPYSPGVQSLKLLPSQNENSSITALLDTISDRAGIQLPIRQAWRFSVWAKAKKPGGELRATFQRLNGSPSFFDKTFELTTEWQEYNLDFIGSDQQMPGSLKLTLTADEAGNEVWVDDVYLGQKIAEELPFRPEIIDALKELKPSFVREFPSLGDTWENRIAPTFERKSWVSRLSGGRKEPIYNYALPEFLALCREIGANPWVILPPTFSDYEVKQFGAYLAKNSFPEIIVEFGHENWNWMYRPQALPYYNLHGYLASRDFELTAQAAGKNHPIRFLVNGHYAAPANTVEFLANTRSTQGVAIAPYFLYGLDKATPDDNALTRLFQDDPGPLAEIVDEVYARDLSLAVSEINLNTTRGTAKGYERNRLVAGAASGSALAKKLIECLVAGADPIMVSTLSQYDTPAWDIPEFVALWGVVRDFGPPVRLRPTGLAMKLLNQAIQGNLHTAQLTDEDPSEGDKITLAAFRSEQGWTLAAVSALSTPATLQVEFPDDGATLPTLHSFLQADSPFATNEEEELVKIGTDALKSKDRMVTFTLAPWGFSVLGPVNSDGP